MLKVNLKKLNKIKSYNFIKKYFFLSHTFKRKILQYYTIQLHNTTIRIKQAASHARYLKYFLTLCVIKTTSVTNIFFNHHIHTKIFLHFAYNL